MASSTPKYSKSVSALHPRVFLALCLVTALGQAQEYTEPSRSVHLPKDLNRSVCTISNDSGGGTGFIGIFRDKPVVVTNQHVIVGQKNLKIRNLDGVQLQITGGALASEADIAMLLLKDLPKGVVPFTLSNDVLSNVSVGDDILIVGNALAGNVLTSSEGKIKALGPIRIEHTAPTFRGNSGSPIYHIKSGTVIGLDTESTRDNIKGHWADQSSAQKDGATIKEDGVRLFGQRWDTEKRWNKIDWKNLSDTSARIQKLRSMGSDSLYAVDSFYSGDLSKIKNHVTRTNFTRATKVWKDKTVSDRAAQAEMIRAITMLTDSISYNLKQLEKIPVCYHHKNELKRVTGKLQGVQAAWVSVKATIQANRAAFGANSHMPPKIKTLIYPDGSILVFED